jgi:hypothetical protein
VIKFCHIILIDLDIDPHTWNVEQLAQWISDQAFKEEISDIIKEQRIGGECLYELASNSSLLQEVGVKHLVTRIKLTKRFKELVGLQQSSNTSIFEGTSYYTPSSASASPSPTPLLDFQSPQASASALKDLQSTMANYGKLTQAAQNHLKALSPHLYFTYQQKKRVIRTEAKETFPFMPLFANNLLEAAKLEDLVKELSPSCSITQLNFG